MPQRMYSHAEFFHSLEECTKSSPFSPHSQALEKISCRLIRHFPFALQRQYLIASFSKKYRLSRLRSLLIKNIRAQREKI